MTNTTLTNLSKIRTRNRKSILRDALFSAALAIAAASAFAGLPFSF